MGFEKEYKMVRVSPFENHFLPIISYFVHVFTSLIDYANRVILVLFFYLTDVSFLPISGLMGLNLKTRMDKSNCPWWDGPCLFEALDSIDVPMGDPKSPFRYILHF